MTLTLYRMHGLWHVHYSGKGSDLILHLFGTVDLPTPYGSITDSATVYNSISRLNPTATVAIECEVTQ